jgi:hypothetical protein
MSKVGNGTDAQSTTNGRGSTEDRTQHERNGSADNNNNNNNNNTQTQSLQDLQMNVTVIPTPQLPETVSSPVINGHGDLEYEEALLRDGFVFLPLDHTPEETSRFLHQQALSTNCMANYTASYMTGKLLPP